MGLRACRGVAQSGHVLAEVWLRCGHCSCDLRMASHSITAGQPLHKATTQPSTRAATNTCAPQLRRPVLSCARQRHCHRHSSACTPTSRILRPLLYCEGQKYNLRARSTRHTHACGMRTQSPSALPARRHSTGTRPSSQRAAPWLQRSRSPVLAAGQLQRHDAVLLVADDGPGLHLGDAAVRHWV